MAYETIQLSVDDGVAEITLNRPERLNAWTDQLGSDLRSAILSDAADEAVRAVLITGAGRGFSSGADLKEMLERGSEGGEVPDVGKLLRERYHPIIKGIRELPKPVIAAVNGPAVGIGCSLALACDLIWAAESAIFGLAFVNIGLAPDGGSTFLVPAAAGSASSDEADAITPVDRPRRLRDCVDAGARVERTRNVDPVVLGEGLEDPGVPREVLLGKARHDATGVWQGHADPYFDADRERATDPIVFDEAARAGVDDHVHAEPPDVAGALRFELVQ